MDVNFVNYDASPLEMYFGVGVLVATALACYFLAVQLDHRHRK